MNKIESVSKISSQGTSPASGGRQVHLYLDGKLHTLRGAWEWDLHADEVFCSDVMIQAPAGFQGTKALIHPEDSASVKAELARKNSAFQFRIITTYGEVRLLGGKELKLTEKLSPPESLPDDLPLSYMRSEISVKKACYEFSERTGSTGTWYINTSTNETWYSDFIYRLHGVAPQSLNPHPHTFHSFVHPDDQQIVSDYFDLSFSRRLPLRLEYGIVHLDGTEKRVLLSTTWSHSELGEEVFHGTMQDVTEKRVVEQDLQHAQLKMQLNNQLLSMAETNTGLGYWHLNLVTRKMMYSENCYRIFRIKPQPTGGSAQVFQSYVHPDDQERYVTTIEDIRKKQVVSDLEFRVVTPEGKIKYIRQRARPLSYGNDRLMAGTMQDITLQRTLEKHVAELQKQQVTREARTRLAESIAEMGSWLWNLTTGEMDWSEPLYELLGYKVNTTKISEKIFLRSVHPEDQGRFQEEMEQCISGRTESELTFRLMRKNGLRYVRALFKFLVQDNEDYFIASFQDVTTGQLAQRELTERVQLIETLSDSIPDIVIVTNSDHSIIQWNRKCEQVFGRKKEDVIGENFFEVFPQLKVDDVIGDMENVLAGAHIQREARNINRVIKGVYNINLVPLKDEEENVLGMLHMLHDVSKETHLHQELTTRLQFIEKLVEATVDRIIVLDRNLNYLYWNKRAADYYDVSKEEVIGKNILEMFPGFMNDPSYKEFRNVLRGEIVHIPAEKNLQKKKGYFETYLIPIKNNEGAVTSILWIVHDLYKEYQLQRQKLKEGEVLDVLNENYLELNAHYQVVNMNNSCAEYLGGTKEELTGLLVWEVLPEASGEPLKNAMKKAMEEGVYTRDEFMSAKTRHWQNFSIAPTIDGIVMVFYDIQREVESRRRLEQVAVASPDAITIYDLEAYYPEYINENLGNWLGYSSQELVDLGFQGRLQLLYPEDRQKIVDFNDELSRVSDTEVKTIDYRLTTREGKIIWVRNRSKVFHRNGDGKVTHILSVLQEVTREKMSKNELVQLNRALETRNKELEEQLRKLPR